MTTQGARIQSQRTSKGLLGAQVHTVTRFGASAVNPLSGIVESGPPTTFSITGSLQPLNPKEQQLLPEGERTTGRAWFFSRERLVTSTESPSRVADRLLDVRGNCWEVEGVEDWTHHTTGLPHYRYRLRHVGRDEASA